MTVSGENDVVGDVVVIQMLKCTIAVSLVTIPSIVVEWICITVHERLVLAREHCLTADDSPLSATLGRRGQLIVEPILLSASHHRTACIVRDFVDIVGVPVEICIMISFVT